MPKRKRTFEECIARMRRPEQIARAKRMAELEARLKRLRMPVVDEDVIIADLIEQAQEGEAVDEAIRTKKQRYWDRI